MQRAHEKVARSADAVAREYAPCPVRAVRGRRQADEQQPRVRVAEAGDRFAPVRVLPVSAPLLARDLGAMLAKPRASFARDDLLMNL
jgi:hypothetical protein